MEYGRQTDNESGIVFVFMFMVTLLLEVRYSGKTPVNGCECVGVGSTMHILPTCSKWGSRDFLTQVRKVVACLSRFTLVARLFLGICSAFLFYLCSTTCLYANMLVYLKFSVGSWETAVGKGERGWALLPTPAQFRDSCWLLFAYLLSVRVELKV